MNNLKYIAILFFCISFQNANGQLGQFCVEVGEECSTQILNFAQEVIDLEEEDGNQFVAVYGEPCNEECTNSILIYRMLIGSLDYDFSNITSGPIEEFFSVLPSLAVTQGIVAKSLKVCGDGWCDYVFYDDYNLMPIEDVEQYVLQEGHLPGFKSEKEYEKDGVIGIEEITLKQQEKIEELFLHIIELDKELDELLAEK